jgi:hypothetical protein
MEKKLFIGVKNSQDRVPASFFWSFVYMRSINGLHIRVVRSSSSRAPIRHNALLKAFLNSDFDYYLEMDVDQVYPPDYLQKMVPLIDEYKAIAPLIFDRQFSNGFMPLAFSDANINRFTCVPIDISDKQGVIEVKYCHSNIFLAREVAEKIEWPPYPGMLSDDGLQKKQHADFLFNDKIREAGYKLYVNLDVEVEHVVEFPMNRKRWEKWHGKKNKQYEVFSPIFQEVC